MLRVDLHIHTSYSMDCQMPPRQVIDRCLEVGINCIAITDHGEIAGALEAREHAPFTVIVGEEVMTPYGEIMGLFLSKKITSPLPPEEVIAEIEAQGGLICIPHPFDPIRMSRLKNNALQRVLPHVNIIEVFNARSVLPGDSVKAKKLARDYHLLAGAGSDAHTPGEIGNACIEMPEFNGKDEFLRSLAQGKIRGHKTSPLVHLNSTWMTFKRKLRERE